MPTFKTRVIGEFDIDAESLEDALETVKRLNASLTADEELLASLGVVSGSWRAVKEDMVLVPEEKPADEPGKEGTKADAA